MNIDPEIIKRAEEYLQRTQQSKPPEDPAVTAAKAAAEAARKEICERWKKLVESKIIDDALQIPPEGLGMPLENALKSEPFVINEIYLVMKLVYDSEFGHHLDGYYASPAVDPDIEIHVEYTGQCADKKARVLKFLGEIISSHIGKKVVFQEDDWIIEEDQHIFLKCWDCDSCWNIADYLLKQREVEGREIE